MPSLLHSSWASCWLSWGMGRWAVTTLEYLPHSSSFSSTSSVVTRAAVRVQEVEAESRDPGSKLTAEQEVRTRICSSVRTVSQADMPVIRPMKGLPSK